MIKIASLGQYERVYGGSAISVMDARDIGL